MQNNQSEKGGKYWDQRVTAKKNRRPAWYTNKAIQKFVSSKSCGDEIESRMEGFYRNLKRHLNGIPADNAVSIGCGNGAKEIALIQRGLVQRIDAYDVSKKSLELAKELAEKKGVDSQITFHLAKGGGLPDISGYSLMHWNASLHHMLDVYDAVRWSHNILKDGGIFACDEYVGPSRFQWTEKSLDACDRFRNALPDRFFYNDLNPRSLPRLTPRVNKEKLIEKDPTEAVQSDKIIEAVKNYFNDVEIISLGGAFYDLAFRNILQNFDDEDEWIIEIGLIIDDLLNDLGYLHIAQIFAKK